MKKRTRVITASILFASINALIVFESLLPGTLSTLQTQFITKPLIAITEFFRPNTYKVIEPTSIEIRGKSEVYLGEKLKYDVIFAPQKITYPSVIWTIDDTSLATVDSNGTITALSVGQVILTCQYAGDESINTSKTIDIVDAPIVIPSTLQISSKELTVLKGTSTKVDTFVDNDEEFNYTIDFYSENEAIATVNEFGIIKAHSYGVVEISARIKDYPEVVSNTITLTVVEGEVVKPASIEFLVSEDVYVGRQTVPEVAILPSNATDVKYRLVSSDSSIAKIDRNNGVVGLKSGTVTISVIHSYDESISYSKTIEIKDVLPTSLDVKIVGTDTIFVAGKTKQLEAILTPIDVTNRKIIWSSSDESIAKIDNNGLVFVVKEGTVEITAKTDVDNEISINKTYQTQKASALNGDEQSVFRKYFRKIIGHFGLYAADGIVTLWFFKEIISGLKKPIIVSGILGLSMAVVTEVLQLIPGGRASQISDMAINFSGFLLGIITFVCILLCHKKRTNKKKTRV